MAKQFNTSINYGIDLGENGGYINFTGDIETRQATNRMGSFEGMIFHGLMPYKEKPQVVVLI